MVLLTVLTSNKERSSPTLSPFFIKISVNWFPRSSGVPGGSSSSELTNQRQLQYQFKK